MDALSTGSVQVDAAVASVAEKVRRLASQGRDALPSLTVLAREAGVARATMHKAVHLCEQKGLIRIVPRKGIFVGGTGTEENTPGTAHAVAAGTGIWLRGHGAARLHKAIAADIAGQLYSPGTMLPSYKLCRQRYGGDYRTVRKAMVSLCDAGLIEPFGRGFRVPPIPGSQSRTHLVYVGATDNMRVMGTMTPRTPEFWKRLERETLARDTTIEIVEANKALAVYAWDDGTVQRISERDRARDVLGYMVQSAPMELHRLQAVLEELKRTGRPIAVIHEHADIDTSAAVALASGSRQIRFFETAATPRCAVDVALHLARLGHRRAAVFYAPPLPRWLNRSAGIEQGFRQAGITDAVRVFAPPTGRDDSSLMSDPRKAAAYNAYAELGSRIEGIYADVMQKHSSWYLPRFNRLVFEPFELPSLMLPCFEQALADPSITVWIGVNDVFALMALSFLSKAGVRVPEDISVVGFDDSSEAFAHNLASYNFNMPALVHSALDFLFRYNPRNREPHEPLVEIEGEIMVRGSLGKQCGVG